MSIIQLFFFFSSRRRHTRSKRDWSSDVCSSDLSWSAASCGEPRRKRHQNQQTDDRDDNDHHDHLRVGETLTPYYDRGGDITLRSSQGDHAPSIRIGSAKEPANPEADRNEQKAPEDPARAEDAQHTSKVHDDQEQREKDKTNIRNAKEH